MYKTFSKGRKNKHSKFNLCQRDVSLELDRHEWSQIYLNGSKTNEEHVDLQIRISPKGPFSRLRRNYNSSFKEWVHFCSSNVFFLLKYRVFQNKRSSFYFHNISWTFWSILERFFLKDSSFDSLSDRLLFILLNNFHCFVSCDTNHSSKRNNFPLQHPNEFFSYRVWVP